MATPQIYVASLADYNAGDLVGRWVDAVDIDDIREEIAAMLAMSKQPNAEEYAIHDAEGFAPYDVGEYANLETVAAVGAGIEQHGTAFAAFASIADDYGLTLDQFDESYRGEWHTVEEWAESLISDCYSETIGKLSDGAWPMCHVSIDWEGVAADLMADGYESVTADGWVYVYETNV